MEHAFDPGDPVLDLAAEGRDTPSSKKRNGAEWISRDEQAKIDAIVNGTEVGRYYLIVGEKGTGKSSMLIEAMQKVDGEGVSMLEAHADVEIFRIRLGRALDFEYHEGLCTSRNQDLAESDVLQTILALSSPFAGLGMHQHFWMSSVLSTNSRKLPCDAEKRLVDRWS
jgi:RecA/RadA recombinase